MAKMINMLLFELLKMPIKTDTSVSSGLTLKTLVYNRKRGLNPGKTIGSKSLCIWEGFPCFIFACKHGMSSAETCGAVLAIYMSENFPW